MTAADRLVAGEPFEPSDQDDEWFGKGIYFWEHAFKQAWWWARDHKKHDRPAVVGAVIRLGYCFDLVDPGNVTVLREYLDQMLADLAANGIKPPKNVRTHRKLDYAHSSITCTTTSRSRGGLSTQPVPSMSLPRPRRGFARGVGSVKKLTCKSASETPGASSPSGTSAKTAATAKQATPAVAQSKFGYIVSKAKNGRLNRR